MLRTTPLSSGLGEHLTHFTCPFLQVKFLQLKGVIALPVDHSENPKAVGGPERQAEASGQQYNAK